MGGAGLGIGDLNQRLGPIGVDFGGLAFAIIGTGGVLLHDLANLRGFEPPQAPRPLGPCTPRLVAAPQRAGLPLLAAPTTVLVLVPATLTVCLRLAETERREDGPTLLLLLGALLLCALAVAPVAVPIVVTKTAAEEIEPLSGILRRCRGTAEELKGRPNDQPDHQCDE